MRRKMEDLKDANSQARTMRAVTTKQQHTHTYTLYVNIYLYCIRMYIYIYIGSNQAVHPERPFLPLGINVPRMEAVIQH